MPVHEISWEWEEAFSKFGFEDGDGWNGTDLVSSHIEYFFPDLECECDSWDLHNYMIFDIVEKEKGTTVYKGQPEVGYDEPREYLPQYLVEFLDKEFPA